MGKRAVMAYGRRMLGRISLALVFAAACGGGGSTPSLDAPASSGNKVTTVDCATNAPTATVATQNFMFTPAATTIAAGQVVKFQLESVHNVVPAVAPGAMYWGMVPLASNPLQVGMIGDLA